MPTPPSVTREGMSKICVALMSLLVAIGAMAQQGSGDAADVSRLSEQLIYSVNRVAERPFDTARAVQVITHEELWRTQGMTLGEVLAEAAGVYIQRTSAFGGVPVIRGLSGKQVQLLIDGVRVNNSTWSGADQDVLNTIDVSQIERIEIVRGVVSVFGSESLGGVINVITRPAPPGRAISGSLGLRYSSAASAFSVPLFVAGGTDKVRLTLSTSYLDSGNLRAGDGVGEQPETAFKQNSVRGSMQYFLSPEKTISASYNDVQQDDFSYPALIASGRLDSADAGPQRTRIGAVSYQDLTSRRWLDSLKVTGFWNDQSVDSQAISTVGGFPTGLNTANSVSVLGGSLELGTFIGSHHHLVYGADYNSETIESIVHGSAGAALGTERGRFPPHIEYRSGGLYLNDHFSIGNRWNASIGARYGSFETSGKELLLGLVTIDYGQKRSAVTSSASVTYHASPSVNLVANYVNGFRMPNVDDVSHFGLNLPRMQAEIPNTEAQPEEVRSFEIGAKFDRPTFSGSVFLFRNSFSNLLELAPGQYGGATFYDSNFNGVQDPGEVSFLQNINSGSGLITGGEIDFSVTLSPALTVFGNYTHTRGEDTDTQSPGHLSGIPPDFCNLGVRQMFAQHHAWFEALWQHSSEQTRLGDADLLVPWIDPRGTPAFDVVSLRGGFDAGRGVRLNLAVENLFDKAYRTYGSFVYEPGRQFVVTTQYNF
jgi:hemoglobin/transferrin/lactoferrin receptor protein